MASGAASADGTSGITEQLVSSADDSPGRKLFAADKVLAADGSCTSGIAWPLDLCDLHSADDIYCGSQDAPACCTESVCCSNANGAGGTCPADYWLGCCNAKKKL
jgi:hypothetical protein